MDFKKIRNSRQVQRAELETENFKIKVDITLWGYGREDMRKARVYVSGADEVDYTEAYEMATERDGFTKGNDGETDALFRKLNRQEVKNMKAVIEQAIEEVPELAAMIQDNKLTFNRKAGCSCGCSPAFVPAKHIGVAGTLEEYDGTRTAGSAMKVRDLWITRKSA